MRARAGFSTSVARAGTETASICGSWRGGPRRPALDLQLKAAADLAESQAGFLRFRLTIKNYNDLRVETQTPRLLVVLELPRDESQWMTLTTEELVLRRRAYWASLQQGHEEVVGQETTTIHIPEDNLFDIEALPDPHGAVTQRGHLMRVNIRDRGALLAVSPAALSAYARGAGWHRHEQYPRALGRLQG